MRHNIGCLFNYLAALKPSGTHQLGKIFYPQRYSQDKSEDEDINDIAKKSLIEDIKDIDNQPTLSKFGG